MKKSDKKILKTFSALTLSLGLLVASGNKSHAQYAVSVVSDIPSQQNAAAIISSIASNIANQIQQSITNTLNTLDGLRLQTGQQTANSKAQIVAMGNIADTQDARQVLLRQEDAKLRAINMATSGASTCNVITGNISGQNIENAVTIWREQVTQAQLDLQAGANDSPSRDGALAGLEGVLASHCKNNATQLDVDQGTCSAITQQPTTLGSAAGLAAPLVGSDLSANIILGTVNHVMSTSDTQAARQFLANSIVGVPLGRLSKAEATTPEGHRRIQERNIFLSRNSVAAAVVADQIAAQQPLNIQVSNGTSQNGQSLQTWAEGTAQLTLGYDNSGGTNFPQGVSKDAWLDLRAKAWFMNPNWAYQLDRRGADQAAKDMALMMSFQIYQNNEMRHKADYTNFLLAEILAILNEGKRGSL